MTDAERTPSAGPSVCPFVALAEDRDRRADAPDESNRCYAEKAPRRRDLIFQADYCYSLQFATCSVFLAWAARNAAEPAYVSEAASRAWAAGITAPEGVTEPGTGSGGAADAAEAERPLGGRVDVLSQPTLEGGLFGEPDDEELTVRPAGETRDWVSASAWADAPWDPDAEAEADELEEEIAAKPGGEPGILDDDEPAPEALQGPRVPAALPLRRRLQPLVPIRARGSGEWLYADAPGREPLVRRRGSVGPPILLAVLGLLVVAIIAFLVPTLLGGRDDGRPADGASPSPGASARARATRPPAATTRPSASPSPTPEPQIRSYVVKPGDTLSGIAAKPSVRSSVRLLQCLNGLQNPNLIQPGQEILIPPDGYSCPPGWRRATPEP